jgi:hypothetical protein
MGYYDIGYCIVIYKSISVLYVEGYHGIPELVQIKNYPRTGETIVIIDTVG